jgi:hypothetical protein
MGIRRGIPARRGTSVGFILIILLLFFAGPNTLFNAVSNLAEIRPRCGTLRQPIDRVNHQSLVGRAAARRQVPFSVGIQTTGFSSEGAITVRITISNRTLGAQPLLYSGGLAINQPLIDGIGIVLGNIAIPPPASASIPIPDSNIRILMPNQQCVEEITLTAGEAQGIGLIPGAAIRAYYRSSTPGLPQQTIPGQLYGDLGLWVGAVESSGIQIPLSAVAN